MPTPVIAIFDIGKTNKKVFLFDEDYNVVFEKSESIPETLDEDGDACENLPALELWINSTLNALLSKNEFDLKAINFATYGASFVFIDDDGTSIPPLYNYLKKFPTALSRKFYDQFGGEQAVAATTASPVLGNLNSGMQLYRVKHLLPQKFSKIKLALHLPQYASFLLTHTPYSDLTSIGCHTNLWDFKKNSYHYWVHEEGIDRKLAPITSSEKTVAVIKEGKQFRVGVGLHDSSAALIPYLLNFSEPFALISTGTWCITLNPFNHSPLTAEELANDCLCYLQYNGKPVKASRLFAGHFHDAEVMRISEHFKIETDFYKNIQFTPAMTEMFKKHQPRAKISLSNSLFAQRDQKDFDSAGAAYCQLIIDLVSQQVYSTNLVLAGCDVKNIYVDGGFCNNSLFMNFLGMAFPDKNIFSATLAQATSLGAALAIHASWNNKPIPKNLIPLKSYSFVREHQL